MNFPSHKISTHHKHDKGRIFAWMALISSTGYASFLTMLPIILSEKLQSDVYVGYYFSAFAVVSLAVSLLSGKILKRFSKVTLTKFIVAILAMIFFSLTFTKSIWNFAALDITRVIFISLFFIILAIFVRDFATEEEIALAEGRFYLFSNIGWVIGPLVGGFMAKAYGPESAFIFTALCYTFLLGLFLQQHIIAKHPAISKKSEDIGLATPSASLPEPEKTTGSLIENIKSYIENRNLLIASLISFGMYFWWSTSSIYIPIALKNLGFAPDIIGLVLSLNIIPLILLEFHSSDGAQKYGSRTYLVMGFSILSLCLLLFTVASVPMLIKLMIMINVGSAFIEPIKEIYFFKVAPPRDVERFYGIYSASYPIAYIAAPLFGSLLLSSFGINGIWLGAAVVFILIALTALTIDKKY
ncbi:MAG: MFS transporter [Candidatus Peregrinibacteria bacterium]|nr:MFS transporter [Candidatus Peregrinibacteria bacterium]